MFFNELECENHWISIIFFYDGYFDCRKISGLIDKKKKNEIFTRVIRINSSCVPIFSNLHVFVIRFLSSTSLTTSAVRIIFVIDFKRVILLE